MPSRYPFILAAFLLLLGEARARVPALDQSRIHNTYKDGELEDVSRELERYAQAHRGEDWLRDDSVFLYKHLGVIYTASPGTREKGKYYLIAMLRILPSAEILDMYVSEEVDRIFLRTRQEFLANNGSVPDRADAEAGTVTASPSDRTGRSAKPAAPSGSGHAENGRGWAPRPIYWAAGGMALAAAGAAAYFLLQGGGKKEVVHTMDVPAQVAP